MTTSDLSPEEPWESQVHELLAGLPPVDPPEGFIQRAIDHRPKYAGRLTALAAASVSATAVAIVGLGLVGDRAAVAPPVPILAARHLEVGAGVLLGSTSGTGPAFEPVEAAPGVPDLPPTFRLLGAVRDGDVVQAVYEYDGRPVSVFAQPGRVSWGDLPADGLVQVDGRTVWSDEARRMVVLEVGPDVVAVVGLDVTDAVDLLGGEPADEITVGDRLRSLAGEVARQAGFP